MGRDELIQRLWEAASIVERVQLLMRQRRTEGATQQIDGELHQLRARYAATVGTLIPERLRGVDDTVAIVMEIEAGRAHDVTSAIASITAAREAKLDAASDRRVQYTQQTAQHRADLALHASVLAEGRRVRRALRAPWRKYH